MRDYLQFGSHHRLGRWLPCPEGEARFRVPCGSYIETQPASASRIAHYPNGCRCLHHALEDDHCWLFVWEQPSCARWCDIKSHFHNRLLPWFMVSSQGQNSSMSSTYCAAATGHSIWRLPGPSGRQDHGGHSTGVAGDRSSQPHQPAADGGACACHHLSRADHVSAEGMGCEQRQECAQGVLFVSLLPDSSKVSACRLSYSSLL